MSALNTINNIANSIPELKSNTATESTNVLGENFAKLLNSTIKENGLSSTNGTTNIQDSFKDVFNELGLGIATSLVAALSASPAATIDEVVEETVELNEENTNDVVSTETTEEPTDSSGDIVETGADVSNEELSLKNILDSIASLTANQSISSEAKNALSSLQSILLESDDSHNETRKQVS